MGFLFYFPSAKIDAFPQAECREHLALEISLPKLFFFFFPHSSCWMFRSNELVFSINVPVLSACACPQSALSWPGGVCWCQGQEPHGAQCPLHEALALLGPPHPPAWGLSCSSSPSDGVGKAILVRDLCRAWLGFLLQNDFVILRG